MSTSIPVTGAQYELSAGTYTAIVTEAGAALRWLAHDGRSLVLSHEADELTPAAFGQLLMPWPNRIDHGRYEFDGAAYELDITEEPANNAIHGLVRFATWTATAQAPDRIALELRLLGQHGYPFSLELAVEYALDAAAGLSVRYSARNVGSRTAPFGFGAHPYLTVGRLVDECLVSVPGRSFITPDGRGIPSGPPADVTGTPYDLREPRRLGDLRLDNAYTDLARDERGLAWTRLTDPGDGCTVALWADSALGWVQLYTADGVPARWQRAGLAVEPLTCPANAFVSGTDLIKLAPGETTAGTWGITRT